MRVAVTGADGFVGRQLCAHMEARGDEVLALAGPGPGARVVDVLDAAAVRAALVPFGPEGLVHLAGVSSVARSHEAPLEAFQVNALGAVNVCAVLREIAPTARLLLVGSGETYGILPPGARATEESPLAPTSPYGASKVAAEVAAFQFHRAYGLRVVATRSFNHIGRGQAPTFAVPSFARQLLGIRRRGGAGVLSVGDLGPVRDFSHVLDVVAAYRLLLERGVPGEAYNVCSGVGRTVRSIVDEMIAVSGVNAAIEVDPARVRPVEIPSLMGDPAKLRALGWEARHSVREALEDALDEARAEAGG
ncbi:MAG: GDP-mannose 4,6-dehydratase [Polyangiaceae bacterium]